MVSTLLAADADVSQVDDDGQTPLHTAAAAGESVICALLLEAGAHADAIDSFEFTPLRWAALHGHAAAVDALLEAGADGAACLEGLSAFELASAAGHVGVAATFLSCGVHREQGFALAIELAHECRHDMLAELLTAVSSQDADDMTHATPRTTSGLELDHSPAVSVRVVDADELALDPSVWTDALSTSTPLLVRGCGEEWSEAVRSQSMKQLGENWGDHEVTVAWSPDPLYHRPIESDSGFEALEMPLTSMPFRSFVELLDEHGDDEYFAVSQSAAADFDMFDGLTTSEPSSSSSSSSILPAPLGELIGPTVNRKNLWACMPPKVSETHFDQDDSVLLQLSGTKRFTLVAPEPLHGLTAYPSRLHARPLRRTAPGIYEAEGNGDASPTGDDGRTLSQFTLLNASQPDTERFPLARFARTTVVDVEEGDALVLPAYWYHRVESEASPGKLNVAVNVWFDAGVGTLARRHRALREWLHVDCTKSS